MCTTAHPPQRLELHHRHAPGPRVALEGKGPQRCPPEAVRQAVGGGCRSGWGRLPSVTNAIEAGTCRQGDTGWAWARRPGGSPPPPPLFQCIPSMPSFPHVVLPSLPVVRGVLNPAPARSRSWSWSPWRHYGRTPLRQRPRPGRPLGLAAGMLCAERRGSCFQLLPMSHANQSGSSLELHKTGCNCFPHMPPFCLMLMRCDTNIHIRGRLKSQRWFFFFEKGGGGRKRG